MTPQELGTAVRKARRQQSLRQDQLAAAANVGVRFIVDLEAGKPTAQMGKALAVLKALGLELAFLGEASPKYPS
jgi:y4mF family transcriptional regulator